MRFITEFELDYPYSLFEIENMKFTLQEGFGNKIAESFEWKETGATTIKGPVKYKASIEIEAFPMDKWVRFKERLMVYVGNDAAEVEFVSEIIEELESFGKPSEVK